MFFGNFVHCVLREVKYFIKYYIPQQQKLLLQIASLSHVQSDRSLGEMIMTKREKINNRYNPINYSLI